MAATSFVTVAAAVVSVSAVIGVAGLAVTAVGAITGNKDLLKAGEWMGYAGIAGGLIGGGIGGAGALLNGTGTFLEGAAGAYSGAAAHVSQAWDEGIGSWFAAPAKGATNSATSAVNAVDDVATPNFVQAPGPNVNTGIGVSPSTSMPGQAGAQLPGGSGNYVMQPESAGVMAPTNQAASNFQQSVSAATNAPMTVTPNVPSVKDPVTTAPAASGVPDWMKYSAMTTGLQGLSGGLSGIFAGDSAEQQMELEKLKNQQAQDQLALQNKRSNYAPRVTFGGIMAR